MSPIQYRQSVALLAAAAFAISSCGGGGGSGGSSGSTAACNTQAALSGATGLPTTGNVVPMTVDGGPVVNGSLAGTINQAYVTITICAPGSTNCQNYDHIWVDTGSTGLRLFCSAFAATLPASQINGNAVANCEQFITSYTWGAVRVADVRIAGESAGSVPIQVIGDTSVPASAPSSCASGTAINSVSGTNNGMGANGILGIAVFQQDCGPGCAAPNAPPNAFYYTCPGGTCAAVNMPTASQLQNVAGLFPVDNNGTLIQMPSLPSGSAPTATGSLIFGIDTQSNNMLGTALVFAVSPATGPNPGFIDTTTTYGDMSEPASYIDSGSNGFFFNDPLTPCTGTSSGFYCPSTTTPLSATMKSYVGSTNLTSFTYNFNIANISSSTNLAFDDVGGPAGACSAAGCTFDWGLPFFYGRSVFTAIEGKTIGGNLGPFFAASTP
jgi:hypothetical protein